MKPTKIAFLATGVFDKGGISRYSRYLIRALRDLAGVEHVIVLSLLGPGPGGFEEPFDVHYFGDGTTWKSKAAFSLKATGVCLSERPSIIWTNHVHLLPLALTLRRLVSGARLVVNVYGLELWSRRQWLHRHTLPRVDLVISDCQFSANYVTQRYALRPERLRVVWDCVDVRRFHPKSRREDLLRGWGVPVKPEFRHILTLGRMDKGSRHKGYDRLLDAMISLREHPHILALFAGEGNDRPRLEERARHEALRGRVFFLGSIPENALTDVYNLCHVFVLVSDRGYGRGEGIPLTPLEAAACAKPIIVGNEDGSQEAVIEGVTGRAVSSRDPEQLRRALLDIALNDDLRERMGQAGRARIEKEFSYEGFREKAARILAQL